MGSREDVTSAQAFIEKFTEQSNQPVENVQEQTAVVVESANPQPVATPIVEVVPEEVVVAQQPVVNPSIEETVQAMRVELDKVKHSYSSLQGKYNKELPDARKDNARLQAELSLLKDQMYNQQASPVETPVTVTEDLKTRLGQEKVDELGQDYVDMVDEASKYNIQQALQQQESVSAQKLAKIQEQMDKDTWTRYNDTIVSHVPNFINLVDPNGDGRLSEEFGEFLVSRYMFDAFDNADKTMNTKVVVDICKMYEDSKVPVQVVAPVAPVVQHNPKAQVVAPNTVNNSTPQLQPSAQVYAYKMSDYINNAQAFAHGKMKHSQWVNFEEKYNNAVQEGKVDLTA